MHERFSTRVRLDEPALRHRRRPDLRAVPAPEEPLALQAARRRAPSSTFEIDFEFKSRLLDALLAANFHHAVNRLVGCFEDRAKALYGSRR